MIKKIIQIIKLKYRYIIIKFLGCKVGKNVKFYSMPYITDKKNISIGSGVTFNYGVYINSRDNIIIGNNVRISSYVTLETAYLDYRGSIPYKHLFKPIVIEDNVWIATKATILPGVTIGEGAIIAAGSIVTKDVPPNHIAKGCPATFKPINT